MSRIPPVPTTRISGLLARQRLTQQYQADQLDLFRLQEQISTGLRITLPSEDAPSALRAISFQRLLSRKEQLGSNIDSGLLFLGSTDATLGGSEGVANALSQIKADTLGVIGTIATDQEREAAVATINAALDSLVTLGNRQFNGRYLFSGSQTNVQPYTFEGDNVVYQGDDRQIRNYSDIGVLFSSSISGQEVFGGISAAVEGTIDLNPPVNAETRLSSLRSGRGINPNGSLQITNTTTNQVAIVDLSRATTIGDVVKLIEDNPPTGSQVDVTITGDGIQIQLSDGDSLSISEVGTGTTARELGLLGFGSPSTIVSEDLDPLLLKTTRLEDLLGTKARASLNSGGSNDNNDILIEASVNGTSLDNVAVSFVDGGDGSPVSVAFDGGAKTLIITIDDGDTTAQEVVDAINADANFLAEIDQGDASSPSEAGSGLVAVGATATTTGGTGETLDQSSGIRVVNGGETYDIQFTGDETVEDLLNRLNRSEAGLLAEINTAGTGINIRSRLSGNDFQIGEINGGTTATQLGIRTLTEDTKLSDFNFGVGVPRKDAVNLNFTKADLTITVSDGTAFDVDLSSVTDVNTLSDTINAINNDAENLAPVLVTAQLNADGNGIDLVDNTVGTGRLTVTELGADLAVTGGIDVTIPSIDFNITAKDGTALAIDLSGAESVGDVLDLINNAVGNAGRVTAQLAASGNGVELIDNTGSSVGDLTVTKISSSQAAEFLGLLDKGQTTKSSPTTTLTGKDRYALETDSVFTSLIRLRDALSANDLPEIERAAAKLEKDIDRVTFAQADVGTRFRSLELSKFNLQDEEIQIRSALSEEIDVDLVEAISQMTARQISLEASLRATANILQLSLLDFL
ncbi:MAG: hypothetical protein GXP24_00630 [Planctomycetes bacterium]|nr:hypothetical protein [Planctomycetota bacterium]